MAIKSIMGAVCATVISTNVNAAVVWSAQLSSTTTTDQYALYVVVAEDILSPSFGTLLTVTDMYLDNLNGGVPAIDAAELLTSSSSTLAAADAFDYYLTNNLAEFPVEFGSWGVTNDGGQGFGFGTADLASVNASFDSLTCELDICNFGGSILGVGDLLVTQFGPTSPTSEINWNVSAVPIPAAVWLFGSGLLGLIGVAKRKKS